MTSHRDIGLSITTNEGKEFVRYHLSFGGLIGFTHSKSNGCCNIMYVNCSNDQERENAKTALTELVNDLIKEGYEDCLIKNTENNEYLWFSETKSLDGHFNFINIAIYFMEQPIKEIQIWESTGY